MISAQRILELSEKHPAYEQLILLSAVSVAWLEPQNPQAALLLTRYRDRSFSFVALCETALQLFLLAGFQVSLEAAFQIEHVLGKGLSSDDSEGESDDLTKLHARGKELQALVYRGNTEKLRANLDRVSHELSEWTVTIGYGLVMSRPGLPPHWRELFEVAVLAAQGFPRQLHSHLRGALNLGASPEEIDIVLEAAKDASNDERHQSALRMWQNVKSTS